MKRLSAADRSAILSAMVAELDAVLPGKAIAASWVPGKDWRGTVYEPIYSVAGQGDFATSAMIFGQMFKEAVMNHGSRWTTVKQPKSKTDPNSVEIALYWREA